MDIDYVITEYTMFMQGVKNDDTSDIVKLPKKLLKA